MLALKNQKNKIKKYTSIANIVVLRNKKTSNKKLAVNVNDRHVMSSNIRGYCPTKIRKETFLSLNKP
jgi:hypothetical protein